MKRRKSWQEVAVVRAAYLVAAEPPLVNTTPMELHEAEAGTLIPSIERQQWRKQALRLRLWPVLRSASVANLVDGQSPGFGLVQRLQRLDLPVRLLLDCMRNARRSRMLLMMLPRKEEGLGLDLGRDLDLPLTLIQVLTPNLAWCNTERTPSILRLGIRERAVQDIMIRPPPLPMKQLMSKADLGIEITVRRVVVVGVGV
jgi:hypothetical protein